MTVRQSEIEIIVSKCVEATVLALHFREGDEDILQELEAKLRDMVRGELERAGVPVQRKRRAIVYEPHKMLDTVRDYLPANFSAYGFTRPQVMLEGNDVILIEGYDRAGWTLDGYVIPRLASGLIVATEVIDGA